MKLAKCHFAGATLDFLGFKVGKGVLTVQEAKIKAVIDYQPPATKKGLRAFLGLINFYRRFVPGQATIIAPLTDAIRKEAPEKVAWTSAQKQAVQKVKKILTTMPVLRAPDFSKEFVLSTDASGVGIGAILGQEWPDKLHPVGYWSRKLQPREVNYSITEQEALALVEGVQQFAMYLLGGHFTVLTDHKALTFWHQLTKAGPRVMRWGLLLQQFDFSVKFTPGSTHTNADALSRQEWAVERPTGLHLPWLPPLQVGGRC